MKTFRHITLGIFAALFIVSSAAMSFAQGWQASEHAGYQGIPRRNGSNGEERSDDASSGQRYPRLPRRPNETNIGLGQPASVNSYYHAPNQDDQNPGAQDGQHAGYSGIPQRIASGREEKRSDDASSGQRYPRLPRRPNETTIDLGQPQSASSYYRASNQDERNPGAQDGQRAGYRGIPQRADREQAHRDNFFIAERGSSSVTPK